MAIRITDPIRSAAVNSVRMCLGGTGGLSGTNGSAGILKVYAGDQPYIVGGTAGTQIVVVQINSIGWRAASNGTAILGTSYAGTSATAGTPVWGRMSDYSGTAYIVDGLVGTGGTCDFKIDNSNISFGNVVTLSVASIIQPDRE